MKIFAAYFVFLSIIIAGCASTTSEHTINNEGIGIEEEAMKDQEHKRNIEELELQQSELLEGLLEEETIEETISEVTDDSEQSTNEEVDAVQVDPSQLLAMKEEETEEVIEAEPAVNEISTDEEKKEPSLMELLESSFEKDTSEDTTKITAQQEPQLPPTPSLPKELAVIPSPEKEEPDTRTYKPKSPLAISSLRKLVACTLVPELMDEIHKRLQKTKDITIADRRLRDSNNDRLMPVVYFDFDQIKIKPDFREMLRQQSSCVMKELEARGDMVIQIEGHADERGSDEYNIALGHRRANAIANSIMAYLTNPEITQIISYGEEFPLVPQSNRNAWARNRRVEFTLLLK